MEAIRVERIFITPSHANYAACHRFCAAARVVYNSGLYHMRQALFAGTPISASEVDKRLKSQYPDVYQRLPAAGAQRTLQILGYDWKSWIAAKKDFERTPQKYQAKPRIPGYTKQAKTYVVNRNGYKIEHHRLYLTGGEAFGFSPLRITCCERQVYNAKIADTIVGDVRIVPLGTSFVLELTYQDKVMPKIALDPERVMAIDLGINNLAAIVTNQPGIRPVLIKGNVIKSINAKYNKDKAALASQGKGKHVLSKTRKRYCAINDYFHKVSRYIVNTCVSQNLGKIVIGLNPEWKQNINLGKVNNQKFTSIPHKKLIDQIRYKSEAYGIQVVLREEAYTSKTSALDSDAIPLLDDVRSGKVTPLFSGKRVCRGLYQTAAGHRINADINGAANILIKEIGNDWLQGQTESIRASWTSPIAIKHIDALLEGRHRPFETPPKRLAA